VSGPPVLMTRTSDTSSDTSSASSAAKGIAASENDEPSNGPTTFEMTPAFVGGSPSCLLRADGQRRNSKSTDHAVGDASSIDASEDVSAVRGRRDQIAALVSGHPNYLPRRVAGRNQRIDS
jgi:hypothetical protein